MADQGEIDDSSTRFSAALEFGESDAFVEAARYWDLEIAQLDRGPFHGRYAQFGDAEFVFGHAFFSRQTRQAGAPYAGLRTFVVPASRDQRMWWRGHDVGGDDIMVFPLGGELEAVAPAGFEILTFSVHEDRLAEVAAQLGLQHVGALAGSSEVIHVGQRAEELRARMKALRRGVEKDASFPDHPDAQTALRDDVPRCLLHALAAGLPAERRPAPHLRSRVLRRAEEYIAEHAEEAVSIAEVCRQVDASERTLRYAFNDRYGVSPKAYLLSYRLEGVRRILRRADAATTRVADAANRWGFWHMGQFASAYRRQFGEIPSDTLRRR